MPRRAGFRVRVLAERAEQSCCMERLRTGLKRRRRVTRDRHTAIGCPRGILPCARMDWRTLVRWWSATSHCPSHRLSSMSVRMHVRHLIRRPSARPSTRSRLPPPVAPSQRRSDLEKRRVDQAQKKRSTCQAVCAVSGPSTMVCFVLASE